MQICLLRDELFVCKSAPDIRGKRRFCPQKKFYKQKLQFKSPLDLRCATHQNDSMTPKPKPPGSPTWPDDNPPREEPGADRILTIRVSQELYDAVVAEAKAARHSINSAATILLEEALTARGKWKPPSGAAAPFWKRGKPKGEPQ
jgi:hypothetical protein